MRRTLVWRFYAETLLASMTGLCLVLTLVNHEWIEVVFGVDPDGGSGALEWAVVGVLAVATVVLALAARAEWRRAATA